MDKDNLNLKIVQMSLMLLFKALNELTTVNEQKRNEMEAKLMNLSPFSFYRVSIQYMIIIEFTKLLEPDTKDYKKKWEDSENENAASLSKLSRLLYERNGDSFLQYHSGNKKKLEEIRKTKFYKNIKNERNKKFSHSDSDYEGKTYGIKTFSEKEISEALIFLDEIKKIYKICSDACDVPDFMYTRDNGTQNFIDYHIVYSEFYNNNLMKAVSEGYTIISKRNNPLEKKS